MGHSLIQPSFPALFTPRGPRRKASKSTATRLQSAVVYRNHPESTSAKTLKIIAIHTIISFQHTEEESNQRKAFSQPQKLQPLKTQNPATRTANGELRAIRSTYTFSTWPNSSSTGVERPKIITATWRRLFS